MYSITLEINQKCNLKCKYCYLGDHDGTEMSKKSAFSAVDIGIEKAKRHRDKTLSIDFVGGEVCLDFDFVKDTVKYVDEKSNKENIKVIYTTTTNAVLLNKEIIDFFIDKNFLLKISLDGTKSVNDLNRITVNNKGSYDRIIEKLPLLKHYEEKAGKLVQVTNVITKNNYKEYYNTLVHITKDLGFKYIDTAIDFYADWTVEEFESIQNDIYKSFDYFMERATNKDGFIWQFIESAHSCLTKKKKAYCCGGGIITLYVKNNGDFYPCAACFKDVAKLGNSHLGLDNEKVNKLKRIEKIESNKCQNCDIYDYCGAKSCMMMNLEVNEDANEPVNVFCWIEKLKYKLIREKNDILREFFGGAKDVSMG